MFARRTFRIIKPFFTPRFYWSQATLTLPNKTLEIRCSVEKDLDGSISIDREAGCQLAGSELGDEGTKIDLVFYDGRHFARGMLSIQSFSTLPILTSLIR